jgi:nitrogen-specific signal transduction histidine kinase
MLRALSDCSVFFAQTDADAYKALRLIDIDLVLRDSTGPRPTFEAFIDAVKEIAPSTLTIAVGAPDDVADIADFVVPVTFTQRELEQILRQAADKRQLMRQVRGAPTAVAAGLPAPAVEREPAWSGRALGQVLKEFTRAFAAGFDLARVLEMILDAIGQLVRPTRSALLMPDESGQTYRIVAQRGVAPLIVESVRLRASEGLCRWLASEGRPARLHEVTEQDVARELALVQGVVAVPLLAYGELVALLVVGQPVFGTSYGRQETETLFDLATHLATAIRDIALHHQLQREKEFSERILAHMSSGVITIGRDEKVGIMNRRAEEILGLPATRVVNHDLRVLPSPLGDMLFDTLSSGRSVPRSEVQLARRGLALEVSTYPVQGDEAAPLGAVLVFEDLTAQKELAARKRQAEQFQLLTRVVARIADEIKNPLVSINTFMELINERYEDPDFRRHFSSVVGRDVRRLVQVFEKLIGLVNEGELHLAAVDAQSVVDDVVAAAESDEGAGIPMKISVQREATPQMVRADALQLRKALSYLVRYLAHTSPAPPPEVAISVGPAEGENGVRILLASRTAVMSPERIQRLFDPVQMVQESLIDVGPAVSQRIVEAQGGQVRVRQGRHQFAFLVTLPTAP